MGKIKHIIFENIPCKYVYIQPTYVALPRKKNYMLQDTKKHSPLLFNRNDIISSINFLRRKNIHATIPYKQIL